MIVVNKQDFRSYNEYKFEINKEKYTQIKIQIQIIYPILSAEDDG